MKLLLVAAVLAAVGGGFAFHEHKAAVKEQKELARVASMLAGRTVKVHCQSFASAALDVTSDDGSVEFTGGTPSDTANLKRNTCRSLAGFVADARAGKLRCLADPDSCEAREREIAEAVHVLTHESMHLRGIQNEAQAECLALGSTAWAAQQLGAPADEASLIQQYAVSVLFPLLPGEYHSAACG